MGGGGRDRRQVALGEAQRKMGRKMTGIDVLVSVIDHRPTQPLRLGEFLGPQKLSSGFIQLQPQTKRDIDMMS